MTKPMLEKNRPKPSPRAKPRRSGVIIPEQASWKGRIAARLIWAVVSLLAATIRFRVDDRSALLTPGGNERILFAFWHNRLALTLVAYRRIVHQRDTSRHFAALVSVSRDGGLLARVVELFGGLPIRGSSSRRGPQALRELVAAARNGRDLAITPDGPRGPCYEVQDGVIATAQLTGLPIVPVNIRLGWKYPLNSWDRFEIPLPFSRCDITLAAPIRVPREATPELRSQLRAQLQANLRNGVGQ